MFTKWIGQRFYPVTVTPCTPGRDANLTGYNFDDDDMPPPMTTTPRRETTPTVVSVPKPQQAESGIPVDWPTRIVQPVPLPRV